MQTKIKQSIFSGIIATFAMSIFAITGTALGMPKISPPEMMSNMFHLPVVVGWLIHFSIGILFAMGYVFFFNNWLKKIAGRIERGAVYGFIVFVIGQIMFSLLDDWFGTEPPSPLEHSVIMLMIASTASHIVFGIVISLLVKPVIVLKKI